MGATKIIIIAAAVLTLVILIGLLFNVNNQGTSKFKEGQADVQEILADVSDEYGYLDNSDMTGSELKETYKDTKSDLYWKIRTSAMQRDIWCEGSSISSDMINAERSSEYYINPDATFKCSLQKSVVDGKLVIQAVQQ